MNIEERTYFTKVEVIFGSLLLLAIFGGYMSTVTRDDFVGELAFTVVMLGLASRFFLARVQVREVGIRIHNPIRLVSVAWRDIARFEMRSIWRLPGTAVVVRTDGTAIRIWGLRQSNRPPGKDAATIAVGELNATLARATV
jgi:hypothetical protein